MMLILSQCHVTDKLAISGCERAMLALPRAEGKCAHLFSVILKWKARLELFLFCFVFYLKPLLNPAHVTSFIVWLMYKGVCREVATRKKLAFYYQMLAENNPDCSWAVSVTVDVFCRAMSIHVMRSSVITTNLMTSQHSINQRTGKSTTLGFFATCRWSLDILLLPDCSTMFPEAFGNSLGKCSYSSICV